MKFASMSQFISEDGDRVHFRCAGCAAGNTPVSDSAPLRVLHLYALVDAGTAGPTPVRTKPVRLVLPAPPRSWAWGVPRIMPSPVGVANPRELEDESGPYYEYGPEASEAIWCLSGPYRGSARIVE